MQTDMCSADMLNSGVLEGKPVCFGESKNNNNNMSACWTD